MMEDKLLTGVLIILACLMLSLMPKVVKGPRFTDRIVAINAINKLSKIVGIYASSYQATSGAGAAGPVLCAHRYP